MTVESRSYGLARQHVRRIAAPAPKRHVVALIDDARAYDRLQHAVQDRALLERAPGWTTLLCRLAQLRPAIAVVDLFAALPHTIDFAMRELAVSRDVGHLVLSCRLDVAAVDVIVGLPPCADAVIVPNSQDDAEIRMRVLSHARIERAVAHVRRLLDGRVAPGIAPHFAWCLSSLQKPIDGLLTVDGMARHSGRSRTLLERVFMRDVGSTPKRLIQTVYALVAVALIEDRQRSIAWCAEQLRFSSPGSLCKSIQQSTGKTIAEIREHGGTTSLANLFAERFGEGRQTSALWVDDSESGSCPTGG